MFTCLMGSKIKQIQMFFVSVCSQSLILNYLKSKKTAFNNIKQ